MTSTTGVSGDGSTVPGQPTDGGTALYPVVVPVRMTRNMYSRLKTQADLDEMGIAAVVRIGLNRWLATVEKRREAA